MNPVNQLYVDNILFPTTFTNESAKDLIRKVTFFYFVNFWDYDGQLIWKLSWIKFSLEIYYFFWLNSFFALIHLSDFNANKSKATVILLGSIGEPLHDQFQIRFFNLLSNRYLMNKPHTQKKPEIKTLFFIRLILKIKKKNIFYFHIQKISYMQQKYDRIHNWFLCKHWI